MHVHLQSVYAYAYAYTNAATSYRNADSDSDRHGNGKSDSDAQTNSNSAVPCNTEAAPESAAKAVRESARCCAISDQVSFSYYARAATSGPHRWLT